MKISRVFGIVSSVVLFALASQAYGQDAGDYEDLLSLFREFRDLAGQDYSGDMSGYAAAMEACYGGQVW